MGEVICVGPGIYSVATKGQLARGVHLPQANFVRSPALGGNPQRRGRLLRSIVVTPRKPNSAQRKVGRIKLSNRKVVRAKFLGKGSIPHKFAVLLVRGGGHRDTPGVGYTVIRGAMECMPLFSKRRRRSIYGNKDPSKK